MRARVEKRSVLGWNKSYGKRGMLPYASLREMGAGLTQGLGALDDFAHRHRLFMQPLLASFVVTGVVDHGTR